MARFADVYYRHVDRVHGFFLYRVRSRETAEDLTSATFERALRAWERYDRRRASELTWLLAIARNLLIDHLRADRSPLQAPLEQAAPSGAEERYDLGLDPELESALRTLGEREREILALRFGADMPMAAVAEAMQVSLANAQQILSRTLRRLRVTLEDEPASAARGVRPDGE